MRPSDWRRLRAMASAIAVPTSTLHLSLPVVIRSPVVRVVSRPRSTQDSSDTGEQSLRSAASAVPLLIDSRIRRSAGSTPFCSDAYMARIPAPRLSAMVSSAVTVPSR